MSSYNSTASRVLTARVHGASRSEGEPLARGRGLAEYSRLEGLRALRIPEHNACSTLSVSRYSKTVSKEFPARWPRLSPLTKSLFLRADRCVAKRLWSR
jgi:hypothetical protein